MFMFKGVMNWIVQNGGAPRCIGKMIYDNGYVN